MFEIENGLFLTFFHNRVGFLYLYLPPSSGFLVSGLYWILRTSRVMTNRALEATAEHARPTTRCKSSEPLEGGCLHKNKHKFTAFHETSGLYSGQPSFCLRLRMRAFSYRLLVLSADHKLDIDKAAIVKQGETSTCRCLYVNSLYFSILFPYKFRNRVPRELEVTPPSEEWETFPHFPWFSRIRTGSATVISIGNAKK